MLKRLKDITSKIGSGATPTGGQEAYKSSGIALIRSQNVLDFRFSNNGLAYIDEAQAKELANVEVHRNDILLNITGDSIARVCLVPPDILPARVNQHVCIIRCNPDVCPNYLLYYLQYLKPYLLRICGVGGTRNALTKDVIEELKIPINPQQHSIGAILSNLDFKIHLNNRLNAELEAMAKTIYDYWFAQFDFPISKEQAKAIGKPKLEGKPYKASGGKMVWSEELKREMPAIWKAESLTKIIEFNPTVSIPKGSEASYIDMDALPQNGFMTKAPMKKAFNGGMKFQNGDVAVARITPCLENGKTGLITLLKKDEIGFGSTEFIILRGRKFDLRSYASCLARSEKFRAYAISKMTGTSGRKRVSASDLEMYVTAIPDDDTLKRFEKLVSPFFEKMTLNALENQKLAELRGWLLPMLMNGQVKIKEAMQNKVIDATKKTTGFRPESIYDYQSQVFALIAHVSKQNKIKHGEMTIAKYAYLIDKVKGIPTFFDYGRHHLGPWAKEMKKVLLNKKNFKIDDEGIRVVNGDLLKGNPYEKQIKDAILELTTIITGYKSNERSHQTELLATVCKVIEDIKSTDLKQVRESMKNWPIDLKTSKFKNKAEKFGEPETRQALFKILELGWDKRLL